MKIVTLVSAVAAALIATSANAWDGTATGKIKQLDVQQNSTYSLRVTLNGNPLICGTKTWGYLSVADSVYDTFVSVMLTSFMSGRTVILYSTLDSSGDCKIGYAVMQAS